MNKFIILLFLLITGSNVFADEIVVCRDITDKGEPVSPGTSFELTRTAASLKIIVKLDRGIGTSRVVIKIYKVEDGKENYDRTITINTEPSKNFFWKEISFEQANTYKIYAYNDQELLLGDATISITFRREPYVGTGMRVKKDENTGYLRIWGLLQDWYSPKRVEHPLLYVGELITEVDGINTGTMTLEAGVLALKGNGVAGTATTVKVIDAYGKTRTVTIPRKEVIITPFTRFIEYYEPLEIDNICEVANTVISSFPDGFGDLEGPEYITGSDDEVYYSTICPKGAGQTIITSANWLDEPVWSSKLSETFQYSVAIKEYEAIKKSLKGCRFECCEMAEAVAESSATEKSITYRPEKVMSGDIGTYKRLYFTLKLEAVSSDDPRAENNTKYVVRIASGEETR